MSLLPRPQDIARAQLREAESEERIFRYENQALRVQIKLLRQEIERLKEGNFTEKEFQNLCHNKQVQDGFENFCNGCDEFQKQLFNRNGKQELKNKITEYCRNLEAQFNWQLAGEIATGVRQFVEKL